MISLNNVTKIYPPDRVIFKDINLSVNRGELVVLYGLAASGKSVLFRMILRYEKPTQGTISVFGRNLQTLQIKEIPFLRRRIGYISQSPKLMRPRTVLDNLSVILNAIGTQGKQADYQSKSMLEKVGLEKLSQAFTSDLSHSQVQKLVIARALIVEPSIILADEPLSVMEKSDAENTTQLLLDYNKKGSILIWATQHSNILPNVSKRIVDIKENSFFVTEPAIPVNEATTKENIS